MSKTANPIQAEMLELSIALNLANHEYYVLSRPTLSDAEFDSKLARLRSLERDHPELADPASPTQRVGSSLPNKFLPVQHKEPMQSLEKAHTVEEIANTLCPLATRSGIVGQWKIDGASLSLRYSGGRLVEAATRGNGQVGESVLANAKTIPSIPLMIPVGGEVEIRGEVLMLKSALAKLNAELRASGDEEFSNARNAASGSIKQKDSTICAKRMLSFFAYRIIGPTLSKEEQFKTLKSWLFTVPDHSLLDGSDMKDSADFVAKEMLPHLITEYSRMRPTLDFDVDGIVFSLNSAEDCADAGLKTKSPRWAIAYKFENETGTTILEDIQLTVGRTGQITPNAVLRSINLCGANITAASLCNQDEINRLGIYIGDEVLVERSNDVIPKVIACTAKKAPGTVWKMPAGCPSCRSPLVRHGVHYYCDNYGCSAQAKARLEHAASKSALDWDGLGPKSVEALVNGHGCSHLVDLMKLTPEQVGSALKQSAAAKFLAGREAAKKAPLWRRIHALGIDHVGSTTSQEIANTYHSLITAAQAGQEALAAVVGQVCAASVLDYVTRFTDQIAGLYDYGFTLEEEPPAAPTGPQPLAGLVFVLTGTLSSGSRPDVAKTIEKFGGKVKGSVTKDVTYLVVGYGGGGGKDAAAKKHGTKRLSEEELYAIIGIPVPVPKSIQLDDLA